MNPGARVSRDSRQFPCLCTTCWVLHQDRCWGQCPAQALAGMQRAAPCTCVNYLQRPLLESRTAGQQCQTNASRVKVVRCGKDAAPSLPQAARQCCVILWEIPAPESQTQASPTHAPASNPL